MVVWDVVLYWRTVVLNSSFVIADRCLVSIYTDLRELASCEQCEKVDKFKEAVERMRILVVLLRTPHDDGHGLTADSRHSSIGGEQYYSFSATSLQVILTIYCFAALLCHSIGVESLA